MSQRIYVFDDFELDASNRVLRRNGEPLPLPAKAFDVLTLLVENRGNLVSKNDLFGNVWSGQFVEESNLTVQISHIRRALGERSQSPRYIETVPGFGYRFNAPDELQPESIETIERITIEHVETTDSLGPAALVTIGAAAACLIFAVVAGFYYLRTEKFASSPTAMVQTRLTNNGRVSRSAISSDGKLLAYVTNESDGNSLWIRQVGVANDRRIIPPTKAEFWGLTFDPNGGELFYVLFSSDSVDPRLYHVPALGGVAEFIPDVFAHSITFSPDGSRFAYVLPNSAANENHLVVQNRDGSAKKAIATRPHPSTYVYDGDFAVWSPDGGSIATIVNSFDQHSNFNTIVLVNPETGSEEPLGTEKWYNVGSMTWTDGGKELLIAAADSPTANSRVWSIPRTGGAPRPLTSDLMSYSSLSSYGKNGSFVARQTATVSGVSVAGENGAWREIVSEVGANAPVRWTGTGELIFRSAADGSPNLWSMDRDGRNRRQLTVGAGVDERGLCITSDQRFIVFVSWRSGKSNLWRVGIDGTDPVRLTDGDADAYPNCTADGTAVVFQRGLLSKPSLWRVPIEGGGAVPVFDKRAKWGALAPDGKRFSYFQMSGDKWSVGIAEFGNPGTSADFPVPDVLRRDRIIWGFGSDEIYFIGSERGAGDVIWRMTLDGGAVERVAFPGSDDVSDFDMNRRGDIVVSTSRKLSDVVEVAFGEPQLAAR